MSVSREKCTWAPGVIAVGVFLRVQSEGKPASRVSMSFLGEKSSRLLGNKKAGRHIHHRSGPTVTACASTEHEFAAVTRRKSAFVHMSTALLAPVKSSHLTSVLSHTRAAASATFRRRTWPVSRLCVPSSWLMVPHENLRRATQSSPARAGATGGRPEGVEGRQRRLAALPAPHRLPGRHGAGSGVSYLFSAAAFMTEAWVCHWAQSEGHL